MDIPLPPPVLSCLNRLAGAGHDAHLVGGCVRDTLLGRSPGDWDICTAALPDEVAACFAGEIIVETGLKHGTLTVVMQGMPVEITTYRRDGEYRDHRRPQSVSFTTSLEEDLSRRDFTVNAMAWRPGGPLRDPFGGQADLAAGLLRCVGEPRRRFGEDALRILRLLRFSAQLGFAPEPETLAAAGEAGHLLRLVSAERIAAELDKLLLGDWVEQALILAAVQGVLAEILPEFAPCIGFDQHSPHHDKTVDRHSFAAVAAAPPRLAVRLALLLHDIGKPATFTLGEDGLGHFYGHQDAGADITRGMLRRLRYPVALRAHVETLVRLHMIPPELNERQLRRMLSRHGEAVVRDLLSVKAGDIHGRQPLKTPLLEALHRTEALLEELLSHAPCLEVKDLAVGGRDLMALGIPPGPALGEALRGLLELVLDDPACNTREQLLQAAQERMGRNGS